MTLSPRMKRLRRRCSTRVTRRSILSLCGRAGRAGRHAARSPCRAYLHPEKIHPQAIIEDVRAQAQKDKPEDQFGLFADFNGINFEEMIDFYRHEQN